FSVSSSGRYEDSEFTLRIYPGSLAEGTIYCPVSARKSTTAAEAIERCLERLRLDRDRCYVLAEVKEFGGEEWILNPSDCPVQRMMLWPRGALEQRSGSGGGEDYRFLLRQKNLDGSIHYGGSLQMWLRVTEERRRMTERGLLPQEEVRGDHADLCCLPELTERSLLDNLRSRFRQERIYTYVGSILIVINPFQFLPIYNPKYVKMYDNHALGDLEPHIYAVADVAYHAMLQRRRNQCIVISGESGSGKTQSTNFLIHHLTALSQKGFASGVEQIILGAGPVLEAFGNAKTAHNNNSSRFGKFIQVNYQESGTVRGAYVEKYLLEKSRLVYQEHNERNYHVFYYLLAGASEEERSTFHLKKPEEYHYLNQVRDPPKWVLQLAMEMVGFLPATRKQIFSLLSAILHLGNIRYKKKTYRDDSIDICNPEVLPTVSELLEVKEEMLFEALTTRKTMTVGERLIVPYKLAEAGTVRDSMAKSLYSALFDWIVFRINHALLNNRDLEESAKIFSIGVLDIFGFEDYENNSFEQFCINFANERLQHYFNQHIFKLEQEEYRAEGISWHNIDYIDNTGCINLISKKPTALLHLLDEESNFPQASNQTLLDKFKRQHEGNGYIEFPAVMEPAFIIRHYAGKVKYGVKDFREKNTDHMRPDIVALLKSSKNAFICGLMGIDPPATFRWAVLRAFFRAMVAFRESGKRHVHRKTGHDAAAPCAVLCSVDSFSFLHHPVHQRSLEILQRCKEEKYSKTAFPTIPLSPHVHATVRGNRRGEVDQQDGVGWNGRGGRQSRLSSSGSNTEEDGGIFVNSTSSKLLERAHGILMRNKNYKSKPTLPKHLLDVKSLKYLSNLTLHDRITKSLLHLHKKKKPPSISAQFQASLNKLMETLGQSEPYFVKCIRSNAEKLPLRFNEGLVLRQLRYTGMLETVRIRQSGYSIKYTFQDFIRHFRVLLPEGTSATQEGIGQYLGQVDLAPDGYQVGKTMVFLREVERQRLQALLHREVLNRIVTLQRRFRALLERKHFTRMRLAATTIQKWWRAYQSKQEDDYDPSIQEGAALCIQTAWRGYKERWRFGLWREAALLLQREWRALLKRREREGAALAIQTAWRCHMAREAYLRLRGTMTLLQAAGKGYLARQSFGHLKEQRLREKELRLRKREKDDLPVRIMGLDLSTWEDRSYKERERSLQRLNSQEERVKEGRGVEIGGEGGVARAAESSGRAQSEPPPVSSTAAVVVRERTRTLDEPCQRTTRAKRESRRMRELEQAKFSLELLKVRATGSGGASSPSEERRWSAELAPTTTPPRRSPQGPGTPDSQSSKGSFELLSMDDEILRESAPLADEEELGSPLSSEVQLEQAPEVSLVSKDGAVVCLPPVEVCDGSAQTGESPSSPRLPVPAPVPPLDPAPVIPISGPTPVPAANQLVLEKLERLNEEKEERQRHLQQQNEREMMDQIRKQKEVLERQRHHFAQSATAATSTRPLRPSSLLIERAPALAPPSRTQSVSAAHPNKAQPNQARLPPPPSAPKTKTRDGRPIADGWAPNLTLESREGGGGGARGRVPKKAPANQGTSISMTDMSENIFFAPKDRVAPCLVSTGPKEESRVHWPVCECVSTVVISFLVNQVSRAGHRKKARMARTRSDFLTRTPTSSLGGESEEEDEYDGKPPLSSPPPYSPTIPKQDSFECFSDSEMVKKTDPYLNLGLYTPIQLIEVHIGTAVFFPLVRGKMRFWGKTKQGEKKSSREKLFCGGDSMDDYMSPPRSPDLTLERGAKEFKENKEPSPKVKRRRSVKISSVALEPAQWGNDALQILTCTNDYRSMNDFLMKKISDLVAEDGGKKDTMVDVVFKKALKEFRLNIFNSYSTALAMDDGKSIRYKDLYALFEQILEKTMRLEQRDWSESPVKVWVNTFKIFLDEFMTEYKPMDSTISKVPKTERKKRRKKDADIVEEHNGHIFKATQYSIPTYCEYCSSLIWMMDRACVCKLCRYACHRKCCLKLTTKCSKKYDPELSSRQFGVEVSRLTNEERTVPLVVEKLINYIEMHGLYTEGIYRKSGSTNKIKELKQGLDTDVNNMNLDDYNIHVIASVFKQWLRDLPNPLMTFELYEEFLRAMCLQDKKEVIRGVYSIIDQLSRTHLNTLERLFFHLVRIAGQEDTNRMSANAIAIVFAPCILRCPDTIDPLQSVQDIGKTTACVELIIGEQMNKYCARLKDINSLEFAENKAKCRLTLIRRSMGKGHVRRFSYHTPSPPVSPRLPSLTGAVMQESGGEEVGAGQEPEVSEHQQLAMQQEERVLTEQIESLQKEKEELTFEMLTLEQRASDDETLESEASIGTADSSENLNVDSEGATSDFSGMSEGKSHRRRNLRRQPDSQDSSPSSGSGSAQGLYLPQPPHRDSLDCPPPAKQEGAFEERSQFTSRGTFNPEKGKQKLKGSKNSPLRHSHDSGGRSRDPPDLPQQRVLYGSNEFMV
uniref:Myosin IXA n=1 Tax=Oncorhynchus kisutch TaxID=8019 RepID=A0A8C7LHC1_ONCKI